MSEAATKTVTNSERKGRSPAYPSIPLGAAIEKAQAQYDAEGKYAAPLSSAFKAWGYSPKSSGGRDTRASLRYFGLIVVEGDGEMAKIKLTEDALRVLIDKREDQTERNAVIRRLALNPVSHKKIWSKFSEGIKSDATAKHFLVWEEGYNESAAEALIAEFKETAAFARLYETATPLKIDVSDSASEEDVDPDPDDDAAIADDMANKPPVTKANVGVAEGERIAFIEENEPGQYLKLIVSGSVDDMMLEALEDYVKRQRKRLSENNT